MKSFIRTCLILFLLACLANAKYSSSEFGGKYAKLKLEIPVSVLFNKTLILSLRSDTESKNVEFKTNLPDISMHVPLSVPTDFKDLSDESHSFLEEKKLNHLMLDLDFFNKSSSFLQDPSQTAPSISVSNQANSFLFDSELTSSQVPATMNPFTFGFSLSNSDEMKDTDGSLGSSEKDFKDLDNLGILALLVTTQSPSALSEDQLNINRFSQPSSVEDPFSTSSSIENFDFFDHSTQNSFEVQPPQPDNLVIESPITGGGFFPSPTIGSNDGDNIRSTVVSGDPFINFPSNTFPENSFQPINTFTKTVNDSGDFFLIAVPDNSSETDTIESQVTFVGDNSPETESREFKFLINENPIIDEVIPSVEDDQGKFEIVLSKTSKESSTESKRNFHNGFHQRVSSVESKENVNIHGLSQPFHFNHPSPDHKSREDHSFYRRNNIKNVIIVDSDPHSLTSKSIENTSNMVDSKESFFSVTNTSPQQKIKTSGQIRNPPLYTTMEDLKWIGNFKVNSRERSSEVLRNAYFNFLQNLSNDDSSEINNAIPNNVGGFGKPKKKFVPSFALFKEAFEKYYSQPDNSQKNFRGSKTSYSFVNYEPHSDEDILSFSNRQSMLYPTVNQRYGTLTKILPPTQISISSSEAKGSSPSRKTYHPSSKWQGTSITKLPVIHQSTLVGHKTESLEDNASSFSFVNNNFPKGNVFQSKVPHEFIRNFRVGSKFPGVARSDQVSSFENHSRQESSERSSSPRSKNYGTGSRHSEFQFRPVMGRQLQRLRTAKSLSWPQKTREAHRPVKKFASTKKRFAGKSLKQENRKSLSLWEWANQ